MELSDPPVPPVPPPAPKPNRVNWGLFGLAALVGLLGGFTGSSGFLFVMEALDFARPRGVAWVLLALIASIGVHEAGHLIAALAMKMRVFGFSIGPLLVRWLHGETSLELRPKFCAGSVSAIPRARDGWRAQYLTLVAAGPAATLLVALSVTWFLATHRFVSPVQASLPVDFAVINWMLFVLGLFPGDPARPVKNDACQIISLLRDRDAAETIARNIQMLQWATEGIRPKDYPPDEVRQLARMEMNRNESLMRALVIWSWAYDREDFASAEAWQAHALELSVSSTPRLRASILAGCATFDLLHRESPELARERMTLVDRKLLHPDYLRHRMEAVHFVLAGDFEKASQEVAEALAALPAGIPAYETERIVLNRLRERYLS